MKSVFARLLCAAVCLPLSVCAAQRLPGTAPLTTDVDFASEIVAGADRFLLREIQSAAARRSRFWSRDRSSPAAWSKSMAENRRELAQILGVRGELVAFDAPQVISTVDQTGELLSQRGDFVVLPVRWPVVGRLWGEGLLLTPPAERTHADVVLIPDADETPESVAGTRGAALAAAGCRTLILRTVSRARSRRRGRASLTNREFLHRPAFVLGRTLIGYETHMALAAVHWLAQDKTARPIGVSGHGEGGMAALFVAALDENVDAVCISGFFGPREGSWNEPLDRNVFRLLQRFGGAELLSMVAPRKAIIDTRPGPAVTLDGNGGAPAELKPVSPADAAREYRRALQLCDGMDGGGWRLVHSDADSPAAGRTALLQALGLDPAEPGRPVQVPSMPGRSTAMAQQELVAMVDRHTQWLLAESPFVRDAFMQNLETSSPEAWARTVEPYRKHFAERTIGTFEQPLLPFNARSRRRYDRPGWTGYEVALDVFPDVSAWGILMLPRGMKPGEKRPVVVCQHGLEGRPTDLIEGDHRAYHDFAARLCDRGFIVFAPQNLYIFGDRFRTLQRKANPIGATLFSIMVPQHQQILNWLKTQPHVDPKRIAFYGLSYGGKSAMRIPPLVPDYCLSICSADFNEWVLKNASTRHSFSYVWTGEYEIFEFDLGSTFNYSQMAALIAPRPFMVERGHFDGVGTDEWVAHEYARVRHLYAARLGLPERTEIEWFAGPHTINGQGTFRFLHRHLDWPEPRSE